MGFESLSKGHLIKCYLMFGLKLLNKINFDGGFEGLPLVTVQAMSLKTCLFVMTPIKRMESNAQTFRAQIVK